MSSSVTKRVIAEEEGPQSPTVYPDSRGFMTIARACLVDRRVHGAGLCQAAMDAQDAYDLARAAVQAASFPNYANANDVQQGMLESMCYQMGTGPLHWHDFHDALLAGDWQRAAAAGLASDWARETPTRAKREMWMLANGTWLAHGAPIPAEPPAPGQNGVIVAKEPPQVAAE